MTDDNALDGKEEALDGKEEAPVGKEEAPVGKTIWSIILSAIGSPLKFFALAVLVCDTVFGVAAVSLGAESFKYSIHMFLAIVGAFFLIALWSPRSLYHPRELVGIKKETMPDENRWAATIVLVAALAGYMFYQSDLDKKSGPACCLSASCSYDCPPPIPRNLSPPSDAR